MQDGGLAAADGQRTFAAEHVHTAREGDEQDEGDEDGHLGPVLSLWLGGRAGPDGRPSSDRVHGVGAETAEGMPIARDSFMTV